MGSDQFPLTRALGLSVCAGYLTGAAHHGDYWISAADVEALLAERTFKIVTRLEGNSARHYADCIWSSQKKNEPEPTHEALLLYPKPIKRDTAEGLLRECVEAFERKEQTHVIDWAVRWDHIIERARVLLSQGRGE